MYAIKRWSLLSLALFHRVTSRANVLTDHSRSGRASLARYKTFKTAFAATWERAPGESKSEGASKWSSMHGVATGLRSLLEVPESSKYFAMQPSAAPLMLLIHDCRCWDAVAAGVIVGEASGFPVRLASGFPELEPKLMCWVCVCSAVVTLSCCRL